MIRTRVLLVYLEPTSYIVGLIRQLQTRWPAGIDILFAGANLSQHWDLQLHSPDMQLLPDSYWQQCRLLQRRMAAGTYAVVHLAGWAGHRILPTALLMALFYRIPVVMESDTPLPHAASWWKRALKQCCYPLLFRLPSLFLPGGSRQAGYLQHYGVEPARLTIACMTVDVTAIIRYLRSVDPNQKSGLRQSMGIAQGCCVFLYVGRLEPHKGMQELLQAFQQLDIANNQAILLLVGDGSMYGNLQKAAADEPRLHCTGRLAGNQLLDIYGLADVFVLPSRFEPWGLVVNEAMAAALPVIATERVGCVDDLVVDGETGLLVAAEAPAALAAAMQQLLDNDNLRHAMGNKGRSLIGSWTLEHEADIVVAGWQRLMG